MGPYTNLIWLIGFAALAAFLLRRMLKGKQPKTKRDARDADKK